MSLSTRGSYQFFADFLPASSTAQSDHKESAQEHLSSLKKLIENTFHEITETHLHSRNLTPVVFSKMSYGNLHLAIPAQLTTYANFYNPNNIISHVSDKNHICYTSALTGHMNFMYIYNIVYLRLLEAINGPESAKLKFLDYFQPNELFIRAHVNPLQLQPDLRKPSFIMALLGYLLLDVIFSQDAKISVKARIEAINLIINNFQIQAIAQGFNEFSQGYDLVDAKGHPFSPENFPCQHFIPRKFLNEDEKLTGKVLPFIENTKLNEIFVVTRNEGDISHDYCAGIRTLFSEHPQEAVQVILGFLQMNKDSYSVEIDKAAIFLEVIDSIGKYNAEQILGNYASYRKGEIICSPQFKAWASEHTNIKNVENYVDLNVLAEMDSKAQLQLLNYAKKTYQTEKKLVDKTPFNKLKSLQADESAHNEMTLKVDLDSDHVDYRETVDRHYRVMTAQLDTSNPADSGELNKLSDAYNYLTRTPSHVIEHTNGHMNGNGHENGNGHYCPRS